MSAEQWNINAEKAKRLEELTYYYHRQADFWEWLESEKGLNNNELFDEFEKWEDAQNLKPEETK